MKKNLLSIAIIAVLVVAMVGGTLAWFTSQAEVENVFNAGTVEIGAEGQIVGEGLSLDNWNPGDTDTIKYTFVNNGSKDLRFRVGFTGRWLNEEGLTTGLSTDNINLLGKDGYYNGFFLPDIDFDDEIGLQSLTEKTNWLEIYQNDDWRFNTDDNYLYYGGEKGNVFSWPDDGILEAGTSVELEVKIKLDGPSTGNDYQGKSFKLSALVQAIQASHANEWDWDSVNFETGLEELPQ